MGARARGVAILALMGMPGCSNPAPAGSAPQAPSFVNRVWSVAESKQVAAGELRVFLSEGTLVMAAPHATPALGTWRPREGGLTITEEGQEYPTDILELTDSVFHIRMHSPGEPVEIRFRPADLAPLSIPSPAPAGGQTGASALVGTKWRLEDLAGKGVVDRAEATLEFTADGSVSGQGSCNRFRGPVTLNQQTIRFGPLVSTKMFCGEAVTNQETEYFAALEKAERWEIRNAFLFIHPAGGGAPLRFARE